MPPWIATVVVLAALSLLACSEPVALRQAETPAANEPGAPRSNPAKRPVETLGPDDAVVRSADANTVARTGPPPSPPPAPTAPPPAARTSPGPPP